MHKIESEFGTVRVYKRHITITANADAVNNYVRKRYGDEVYILSHFVKIEQDEEGGWAVYEDYTYWDDEFDTWVRCLEKDGSMPCYYYEPTLQKALWLAWRSILDE